MQLPVDVRFIIKMLNEHGHEAYAVGGCVRDSVLGRAPEDWDITTSALPEETKLIFKKTFDTGIEHGTITVLLHGVGYEVTTYRVDGKYEDSRHPTEVSYTRNLTEDLLRRDFTINAMAYNANDGFVDIFGGMEDLDKGIIRCVGNANARFGEDALRILRAIRFSAQLGFVIEEETKQGIRDLAHTLRNISAERIQVEMVKLLTSKHPEYVELIDDLGVSDVIFPEWKQRKDRTYAVETLKNTPKNKVIRLAVMLYDKSGDDVAKQVLRRWKFDNETMHQACKLVRYYDYKLEPIPVQVRRAVHAIGAQLFPYFLEVQKAKLLAQKQEVSSSTELNHIIRNIEKYNEIYQLYNQILDENQCITLKQLEVKGSDLLEHGICQGKEIGYILDNMLQLVLENPQYNTKEYLLAHIPSMK